MENPLRTAEHNTRIINRRNDLQNEIADLVPATAEVVCEFGCGHGHFLAAYAAAHPDQLCVGLDISAERIDRGIRKRNRAKLGNLHFIHAEARDFLYSLPPGITFSDVYILFPDPWPKRRHHKNRLVQPDFLHALAGRAGRGARLCFRTDFEPYFREAEALFDRHPDWKHSLEDWPFEHVTVFQSRAAQHYSLIARLR